MGILKLAPLAALFLFGLNACSQAQNQVSSTSIYTTNLEVMTDSNSWNELTPEEERVIVNKGTEMIWVADLNPKKSRQSYDLQPGKYRVIFRVKSTKQSIYSVVEEFTVSSGTTTIVKLN